MSLVLCLVTCPSVDVGTSIGRKLVEDQLAACVNILPTVHSVYRWQGQVCAEDEALMILKSSEHLIERLRDRVFELHPYEVPEFVCLSPSAVSERYAEWLGVSVLPRA